jgi:hypothetical protein
MGYALLFENMLPSVLKVRDACLKEGGTIIPSKTAIFIAGFKKDMIVQDIGMSTINKGSTTSVIIECCPPDSIVTSHT